jgi:hypothetical protein
MGEQMDEYSKTSSKTYKTESNARRKANERKAQKVMEASTEDQFIESLEKDFGVRRGHPAFNAALNAWKARHS